MRNCSKCGRPYEIGSVYSDYCDSCREKLEEIRRELELEYKNKWESCNRCNGMGKVKGYTCTTCDGKGDVKVELSTGNLLSWSQHRFDES